MIKISIAYSISCLFLVIQFSSCGNAGEIAKPSRQTIDTIAPVIAYERKLEDTVYLHSYYVDPGVNATDENNGELICLHRRQIEIKGTVNTEEKGIYFLSYVAKDSAGNKSSVVTRTVHVMENPTAFLNGLYNVCCTCTVMTKSSSSPTISIVNYTASVSSSSEKNSFELNWLNFGPEFNIPSVLLKGNDLMVHCNFLNGYDWTKNKFKGSLSSDKNSFTIETFCVKIDVPIATTYKCKNVYTRMVIIK